MVFLPEGINGVTNHLAQRLKAGRDLLPGPFRSRRDSNVAPVDGEGSNEGNASFQIEDHGTPLLADVQEDAMVRNSFTGQEPGDQRQASDIQDLRVESDRLKLRQIFGNNGFFQGNRQDVRLVRSIYDGKVNDYLFDGEGDQTIDFVRNRLPYFPRILKGHLEVSIEGLSCGDRHDTGIALEVPPIKDPFQGIIQFPILFHHFIGAGCNLIRL